MSFGKAPYTEADFHARYTIDEASACWNWTGAVKGKYGAFGRLPGSRVVQAAHRYSYKTFVGDIPEGVNWHLHHRCSNTLCVNPAHLQLVSSTEHRTLHTSKTCKRNHDPTELYVSKGQRYCRTCQRESSRRRWHLEKVPCIQCGTPRTSPKALARRQGNVVDTGLCRDCWQASRIPA